MTSAPQSMSFGRDAMIAQLDGGSFDVLVVGGGITGVGTALDAVTRGWTVALVERDDFASGTSSKSSKLVHGGLRYLQQGDVRLVYEALHERKRLRRNAPHLVKVLPFMIPILTKDSVVSRKIARALGSAMWMYDLTGGWRIGRIHRRLRAKAAIAHFPTMDARRLSSAYLYYDAEADDARLCLTVARTAADHGAVVANRCAVVSITGSKGEHEVRLRDTLTGREFTARARVVVNAAGVWSDDVRALDERVHPDTIQPAKGVHLTVPWEKVRNDIAVVIPVPRDRRSLFVVPWVPKGDGTFRYTYVGTTDTAYDGPVDDPQCTRDDIQYVLDALNASVTTGVTMDDVTGVWSGLRPLVKATGGEAGRTADLSRRHKVSVSGSGVVTVTGGKLTTYREMAEDTIDEAETLLGRSNRCRTKTLSLHGATARATSSGTHAAHLHSRHGTDAPELQRMIDADPSLGRELVPGLPYLAVEAVWAVTREMAVTLDDILTRRTRARLFDRRATRAAAEQVAALVAPHLGWSSDEQQRQVAAFVDECAREEAAALVTEEEFIASSKG